MGRSCLHPPPCGRTGPQIHPCLPPPQMMITYLLLNRLQKLSLPRPWSHSSDTAAICRRLLCGSVRVFHLCPLDWSCQCPQGFLLFSKWIIISYDAVLEICYANGFRFASYAQWGIKRTVKSFPMLVVCSLTTVNHAKFPSTSHPLPCGPQDHRSQISVRLILKFPKTVHTILLTP